MGTLGALWTKPCINYRHDPQHGCSPPCRLLETQARAQNETNDNENRRGSSVMSQTLVHTCRQLRFVGLEQTQPHQRNDETGPGSAGNNFHSFLGLCGSGLLCSVFSSSSHTTWYDGDTIILFAYVACKHHSSESTAETLQYCT